METAGCVNVMGEDLRVLATIDDTYVLALKGNCPCVVAAAVGELSDINFSDDPDGVPIAVMQQAALLALEWRQKHVGVLSKSVESMSEVLQSIADRFGAEEGDVGGLLAEIDLHFKQIGLTTKDTKGEKDDVLVWVRKEGELPYNSAAHEISGKNIIFPSVTWQCLGCGRVYFGDQGEGMARYCCHTHRLCCECGGEFETSASNGRKGWLACDECRRKKAAVAWAEKIAAAELVDESMIPLDGNYMVTDGDGNYWGSTDEYLESIDEEDDLEPDEFLFVAEFRPVVAMLDCSIENACDDYSEDISDQLDTSELEAAFEAFNRQSAASQIGSFFQVAKKVRVPEVAPVEGGGE